MSFKISKSELDSIMAEVQRELDVAVAGAGRSLRKSNEDGSDDDDAPAEASGSGDDAGAPGDSDSGSAPAPDASASSGPPADASAGGPPPEASASAPADPASPDQSAPLDVQSLTAEYAQLPDQELEMHFVALKAALMQRQGGGASPDASAPPMGASPSAPPGPPMGASPSPSAPPGPPDDQSAPPPAMKGEMSAGKQLDLAGKDANGGLVKSEQAMLKTLKEENANLKQQVEGLAKAVNLIAAAPARKAMVSAAQLKALTKSEDVEIPQLTKKEAIAVLAKKALDPSLTKNDRSLINKFCVDAIDVQQIAHLLK